MNIIIAVTCLVIVATCVVLTLLAWRIATIVLALGDRPPPASSPVQARPAYPPRPPLSARRALPPHHRHTRRYQPEMMLVQAGMN